jgi:hypothetical protein
MKYAVQVGSGVIYTKFGSGIQKLIMEELQTHRQHSDLISLLLNFKPGIKISVYYESHSKNRDTP